MKREPKQGEQNNMTDQQQRDALAANLAFLVVQAHRHCQQGTRPTAKSNAPDQPKLKGKAGHMS